MKWLLSLLAALGIIVGSAKAPITPSPSPEPTTTQTTEAEQKTITVDGNIYAYTFIQPTNPSTVALTLNLPDKKSTTDIMEAKMCTYLTSGGFYDTNDTPIGLFLVDGITQHEASVNNLFNGYLWAEKNGNAGIGTTLSNKELSFALQTGPILIEQKALRQLKLTTDQNARRIVVATTPEGKLVFMAVYAENTQFSGPQLVNLPAIVQAVGKQEQLSIRDAINLDGGNHSAFYGKETTLTELSPVGSTFCIK